MSTEVESATKQPNTYKPFENVKETAIDLVKESASAVTGTIKDIQRFLRGESFFTDTSYTERALIRFAKVTIPLAFLNMAIIYDTAEFAARKGASGMSRIMKTIGGTARDYTNSVKEKAERSPAS
jgi:hypothetical protein